MKRSAFCVTAASAAVLPRVAFAQEAMTMRLASPPSDDVTPAPKISMRSRAWLGSISAETVDMMAEYASLDPKIVARSTRSVDAEYASTRDIQPLIDVSLKYRTIDRAFNAAELISPAALRPSR